MYKLVIVPLLFAAVSAGYLGGGHLAAAPLAVAAPAVHAAPLAAVHAAPLTVAHAPVATSYANTYKVSVSQPVAVAHAAPAVLAAPVALGHGYHG